MHIALRTRRKLLWMQVLVGSDGFSLLRWEFDLPQGEQALGIDSVCLQNQPLSLIWPMEGTVGMLKK
jgi:hypothetical protein